MNPQNSYIRAILMIKIALTTALIKISCMTTVVGYVTASGRAAGTWYNPFREYSQKPSKLERITLN